MSIYDRIAQGVAPIGRDVPQIADMLANKSRFEQLQKFGQEERDYRRGRDKAADLAAAEQLKREHTREQLGAAFFIASKDPNYQRGFELLPEASEALGVDLTQITGMPEEQVRDIYRELGRDLAGMGAAEAKSRGAPVKVKGAGGRPIFTDPEAALGQEAYEDESEGARGTWSSPWRGVNKQTGELGLWQTHSITGKNVPAMVGAEQIGAPPDAESDGGPDTAAQSLVFRQAAAYYGGTFDPRTGDLIGLDRNLTAKVQEVSARASQLLRGNPQLSVAEAVQQAAEGPAAAPTPTQPTPRTPAPRQTSEPADAGTLPPQVRANLKEGVRTRFKNGQVWTLRNGQPVRLE